MHCVQCHKVLDASEVCDREHGRSSISSGSDQLSTVTKDDSTYQLPQATRMLSICETHQRRDFLFYCRTCNQVCCAQCVSDELHKLHDWQDFQTVFTQKLQQYQSHLHTINQKQQRLFQTVGRHQLNDGALQSDAVKCIDSIRKHFETLRQECLRVIDSAEQVTVARIESAAARNLRAQAAVLQDGKRCDREFIRCNLRKCCLFARFVSTLKQRSSLNGFLRHEKTVEQLVESIAVPKVIRGDLDQRSMRLQFSAACECVTRQNEQLHRVLLVALAKYCRLLARFDRSSNLASLLLSSEIPFEDRAVLAKPDVRNFAVPRNPNPQWIPASRNPTPPKLRSNSIATLDLPNRLVCGFTQSDTRVYFIDCERTFDPTNNNADRFGMYAVKYADKIFNPQSGEMKFGEVRIVYSTAKKLAALELISDNLLAFFCNADRLLPPPVFLINLDGEEIQRVNLGGHKQVGPASICRADGNCLFVLVANDTAVSEISRSPQEENRFKLTMVHELEQRAISLSYSATVELFLAIMSDHSVHILNRQLKTLRRLNLPTSYIVPLNVVMTSSGLCFVASTNESRAKYAITAYLSDGNLISSIGRVSSVNLGATYFAYQVVREFVDPDEEQDLQLQHRFAFCIAFCTNDATSSRIVISEYR